MITKYSGTTKVAEVVGMTFDDIYPVGSIYISADGTKPKLGVWEEFASGRTLLGVSADHSIGSTGGEETHKLTIDEMPRHSHVYDQLWTKAPSGNQLAWGGGGVSLAYNSGVDTKETGNNAAHNNMPPYITVTFFRRTS